MKQEYKLRNNHILRVWKDTDCESPNNWGNEDVFLIYDHRQFTVERNIATPLDIHTYLTHVTDDDTLDLRNDDYDKYWIFNVYAYIHSGVSLSLANTEYPFNCNWDCSTTGYILVERHIINIDISENEAKVLAEGLIKTWNTYLSGEIYGFTIFKKLKCKTCGNIEEEDIDSFSGFYKETDVKLLRDMLDNLDSKYYPKDAPTDTQELALVLLS